MKDTGMTFETNSHSREEISDMGDVSRDISNIGNMIKINNE